MKTITVNDFNKWMSTEHPSPDLVWRNSYFNVFHYRNDIEIFCKKHNIDYNVSQV